MGLSKQREATFPAFLKLVPPIPTFENSEHPGIPAHPARNMLSPQSAQDDAAKLPLAGPETSG